MRAKITATTSSALLLLATLVAAQNSTQSAAAEAGGMAAAKPVPLGVPAPGPTNAEPYAPQPIEPGGIVVPLYPPDSPLLKKDRVREAEKYTMTRGVPGRIQSIVNVHNPSIEVHTVEPGNNTGAAVILVPGGGHSSLVVGTEGSDFVPYFRNFGVNTVILRYRLRRDGYSSQIDAVHDALQSIRLVRARATEWGIDLNKIGIMGFSAGAELSAPAAIVFEDFDKTNNMPGDALAGISSRPDFVGIVYPGPTPFARGASPAIPRTTPPAFITCAGAGDKGHAVWANEYFTAMLNASVPNVEMHIYGNGVHANGLKDRDGTPFGKWQDRFIDWFRDLGFLQKPGLETKAAVDVKKYASQPAGGRRGGTAGGPSRNTEATATNAASVGGARK